MILQNILWPEEQVTLREMYIRNNGNGFSFDTYWNMFYIGKWIQYTDINDYSIIVIIKGNFEISLYDTDELISRKQYGSDRTQTYEIPIPYTNHSKYVYIKLEARSEKALFVSGAYITHTGPKREPKIAIDICTYKRETYLERNLMVLKQALSEDFLRDKFYIYVVDNGKTIDKTKYENNNIHIIQSINAGGTGGFTRGIIEAIRELEKTHITHILLMDDDIDIEPETLYRTISILSYTKDEYRNAVISGAMFRTDNKYIQHVSAVKWKGTDPIIDKPDMDMRDRKNIIGLSDEYETDYASWWYACYPVILFRDDNLPLPLFLHNDDVEYGLRNKSKIILLPGISVWHDSFENKRASSLSYYDIRNAMILDALYPQKGGRRKIEKYICKRIMANSMRHRYRDVTETYMAVCDYLKGPDYLISCDPVEKNQQVINAGYKFATVDDKHNRIVKIPSGSWPTKVFRYRRCVLYDPDTNKGIYVKRDIKQIIYSIGIMIKTVIIYDVKYKHTTKEYRQSFELLTSLTSWLKYLKL